MTRWWSGALRAADRHCRTMPDKIPDFTDTEFQTTREANSGRFREVLDIHPVRIERSNRELALRPGRRWKARGACVATQLPLQSDYESRQGCQPA